MHLHAVILAGGRGERFWPLSRRDRPKQFLRLIGNRSLLQSTFDRLAGWIPADRRWVVAGNPLIPRSCEQVPELRGDRTIVEPVARNTAAAIGAAAAAIESIDPGAVMVVLPSDHWIPDAQIFREDVESAAAAGERGRWAAPLRNLRSPIPRPDTDTSRKGRPYRVIRA